MNLASRCTRCGTLFRVVRDQLWVSLGRVRCGRCGSTFNAFDQLFDLEQGRPPPWLAPQPSEDARSETADRQPAPLVDEAPDAAAANDAPAVPIEGPVGNGLRGDGQPASETALTTRSTSEESIESGDTAEGAPWDVAAQRPETGPADAAAAGNAPDAVMEAAPDTTEQSRASYGEDIEAPDALLSARQQDDDREPAFGESGQPRPPAAAMPDFVRRAERQARWQRPKVRLGLAALALLLLIGLLLQSGLHFRDRLAAQSPSASRALGWLCTNLNCSIEPPRRIADVTIESSALSRVAGDGNLFRIALTLRNRGSAIVAMPALDLSLMDGTGQLVARRALRPAELKAAPAVLPPSADTPLTLLISTEGQRVARFKLEVFYP